MPAPLRITLTEEEDRTLSELRQAQSVPYRTRDRADTVDLAEVDLQGANLSGASLEDVKLNSTKFSPDTRLPDGSHWRVDRDLRPFTQADLVKGAV
jgi:uncharacterized protein YjbI with pentapeptide repeats